MEQSWFKTEDGREALTELSNIPAVKKALSEAGKEHVARLADQLLNINLVDPSKDRAMLIMRAEIDGARGMLNYIKQLLEGASRKN